MGFCFCSVSIMQISECNFHRTGNPDYTFFSLSLSIIDALLRTIVHVLLYNHINRYLFEFE